MKMLMKILGRIGLYLLVAFIVFYAVFPFYWAIVSSLKTGSALFTSDLIPTSPTFENYIALFREQPFAANILNSAIVAVVTTAISLGLAATAAYALGRMAFRGRTAVSFLILSVSMFPQIAVLTGMFELIQVTGLYDSLSGLILADLILTLPFSTWVLTAFIGDLPRELEEAAIIDGAPPLRILTDVFLPVMAPALKLRSRPLASEPVAAWATRTLARTETFMPMKPADPESTAPIRKPIAA